MPSVSRRGDVSSSGAPVTESPCADVFVNGSPIAVTGSQVAGAAWPQVVREVTGDGAAFANGRRIAGVGSPLRQGGQLRTGSPDTFMGREGS